jgi:carotenoid cleavage dioxygenase-like enzyme
MGNHCWLALLVRLPQGSRPWIGNSASRIYAILPRLTRLMLHLVESGVPPRLHHSHHQEAPQTQRPYAGQRRHQALAGKPATSIGQGAQGQGQVRDRAQGVVELLCFQGHSEGPAQPVDDEAEDEAANHHGLPLVQ